jgi:hypothetical protein
MIFKLSLEYIQLNSNDIKFVILSFKVKSLISKNIQR